MEDQAKYETISGLRKRKKTTVVCPYCQGRGLIERRKFFGHTEGWTTVRDKCGVCDGSRVLERIVTIEYVAV